MNYKYMCLNPIADVGLNNLTDNYARTEDFSAADAVFVRSAKMDELTPGDSLLAVARAGAGVNNIPHAEYAKKGIVVFNTPGANANGVKELVIAAMLLASRDIVGGIEWNNPPALNYIKVYDDENIIYTFHCYEPHEFTHQQGVLQANDLYYNRKMPYPCDDIERYRDFYRVVKGKSEYEKYSKMDIEFLRDYLAPVVSFIERNPDKILWCGEFGTIRHAKLEWRENWMRDMISILNEWDIPYCVWNYLSTPNDGNRFSLVDDDNRKILSEKLHKIILGEV